jgi:energy-converting hydrogenase Eha subunit H
MTEWEKQNMLNMSDEELEAEVPKWTSDSSRGAFARAELEHRRHAAITSTIRAAAKPHKIFKWTLFFTVVGAVAATIAANRRDSSLAATLSITGRRLATRVAIPCVPLSCRSVLGIRRKGRCRRMGWW